MLRFHRQPNRAPTGADLSGYQTYPFAVPTYALQDDYDVVDRTRWYPHRFEITSGGESPFCSRLSRGLYTNSDGFAEWLNERYIPALVEINAAFSGKDATTTKLPTVEHLRAAIDFLKLDEIPPEAKDVVTVATEKYVRKLHGAIYFILAYNLDEGVIEHRACAISAAMRRPPFSELGDDDPKHRATFEAIAALVIGYVRRMEQESHSPGKKWLPWTVPTAGSGTIDRKEGISVALGIARMCRWTDDTTHFEEQARMWHTTAKPEIELRSKLAEWVANCHQKYKGQVECIDRS
jgi:hypothetical protein